MEEKNQTSKVAKVLKVNAVGLWVYDSVSEICGICRSALSEGCIECQANQESINVIQCQKVVGKCNHSFHSHCIQEWAKKQNNCPLDFSEWMPMKFFD